VKPGWRTLGVGAVAEGLKLSFDKWGAE